MFHLHILGALDEPWLGDGCKQSKESAEIMGKWYGQYKQYIRIYLLYVNHPVHPV